MPFIPLKKVLETVMQERELACDTEAYRVFFQWPEIAGRKVAEHTRPTRVKDGVLYLEVDDHLWLAQLKYMKKDLLEKIGRAIKPGLFNDLKFFLKRL